MKTFGFMQNRVKTDESLNREENHLTERRHTSLHKKLGVHNRGSKTKVLLWEGGALETFSGVFYLIQA